MNQTQKVIVVFVFLVIILGLLVAGPFFSIWSLNTLFGLQIPYCFKTWCAAFWLILTMHGIKLTLNKRD